jgi:hypothetical protein
MARVELPRDLGPRSLWLITSTTGKPPVTTIHDILGRDIRSATFGFEGQLVL